MIQIPHNLLMPLAGGLAVVAVGVGVYIGRATAQPPAFLPSSQSVPLAEEPPPKPSPRTRISVPSPASTGDIGEDEAKAVALSHAGLLEEEVTSLLVEKDWDDGRLEYDVDFWQEMVEYEFTIDGVTGVVLKHKREDHADAAASFGDIGKAAAKNAALDHEGLTESQVSGLWAEVDWDNGRLIYDVVFWAGMVEYEYEIDGATGAVLKHEQESHLEGGSAAGDIGGAEAKAAALAHAGLTESQVTAIWVERDWDDGHLEYDVDFWLGAVEYEFTIDGATGAVLKFERENHTIG